MEAFLWQRLALNYKQTLSRLCEIKMSSQTFADFCVNEPKNGLSRHCHIFLLQNMHWDQFIIGIPSEKVLWSMEIMMFLKKSLWWPILFYFQSEYFFLSPVMTENSSWAVKFFSCHHKIWPNGKLLRSFKGFDKEIDHARDYIQGVVISLSKFVTHHSNI